MTIESEKVIELGTRLLGSIKKSHKMTDTFLLHVIALAMNEITSFRLGKISFEELEKWFNEQINSIEELSK